MPDPAQADAEQAIKQLKSDVRKLKSDDLNTLADNGRYIDTEHMSPDDERTIIDGYRKSGADKQKDGTIFSDKQIIEIARAKTQLN